MMKKLASLAIFGLLYCLFLAVAFLAGFYVRDWTDAGALSLPGLPAAHDYRLLDEIRALLQAHYIGALPDEQTLEHGAARGMVSAVGDPYTVFVDPPTHELETQSLAGEYGGIGVELTKNQAGEVVLSPFPDSPAIEAGLVEGDVLLAVDHMTITTATTLDEATALVRGLVGTSVTLRVRHPAGDTATLELVRQNIPLPSVMWRIVSAEAAIGLISINRFSDKTPQEVERAAAALQTQGAARFILDVRNNGGGILESAVGVAGKFLDGGVVMYETQKDAPEKTYAAPANADLLATAPLVVLVNHSTASAAEIVAGALLDRGRAPLIGQTTFGKGSVQLVYELSDKSSLHVTAYLWYTPARRQLDRNGLTPSVVVEPAADGRDAELARAIEYLLTGQ
jgi:carboxyl-terminal processing protease